MDSGVARKPILDLNAYKRSLRARLDPTAAGLELIFERVRAAPKTAWSSPRARRRRRSRAALLFAEGGYARRVLVGRRNGSSRRCRPWA